MNEEKKLLRRKRKAQTSNNETELLSVCASLASLYMDEGRYDFAVEEYTTISKIYKQQKKSLEYGTANRGIAEAYLELNKFKDALNHLNIYLKNAKLCENKLEQQRAYASIGHTYLTQYLVNPSDESKVNLDFANTYFKKSLNICQSLTDEVSKFELADMHARLYLNFGLVQDSLDNFEEASDWIIKSINICKANDIYEQLQRSYVAYGALLEKRDKNDLALRQFNLATEIAEKLKDRPILLATSLMQSADILIRLGDFEAAKNVLLRAYKLKITHKTEAQTIETNLRIAESMRRTHEKLLATDESDYTTLKKLYERLGDGACQFKSYKTAIPFYIRMLECALKANMSDSELSNCYYSLAETYKDNNEFTNAIKYFEKEFEIDKTLKDSLNTLSKIADTKEEAHFTVEQISETYKKAIELCKQEGNIHEEGRMQKRYVNYLRRAGQHTEAYKQELILADLNFSSSDTDAESSGTQTGSVIGDDVDLDELIGDSNSNRQRRTKNFRITKNIKGETQLHTACIKGNLAVVNHLLEQGHPVNVRDNSGWLPLHEACSWGHLEIVKILLDKGANINDRGGEACSGITPLHDAACNGFLDIVNLLLERGANPTIKTDNQETVLEYLQKWRVGNLLNEEDSDLYNRLVKRISTDLEKIGCEVRKKTSPIKVEALVVSPTKDYRRCSRIGLDDDDNTSENNDYKNVMDNLRRKKNNPITQTTIITKTKRSALVAADEIIDDWLEDDIGKTAKKQKISQNSPLKTTIYNIDEIPDENNEILHETQQQRKRKNQISLISAGFSRQKTSPETIRNTNQTQIINNNKKRKHQIKLTDFTTKIETEQPSLTLNKPTRSFDTVQPPIIESIIGIDVKIEDKLFRVPVQQSQINTLTIKWLADEAARRYARKEYMLPNLELQTKSGAILTDDDPLSLLFIGGDLRAEEINGRIIKYHVPPISERYKEASVAMNTEENNKIMKALQSLSINLNLSYEGLKGIHLTPLCKALNRQTNLLELNLSGNFLTSECVRFLSVSLNTLTNLYKIDLSCTGLTSENLEILNSGLIINNTNNTNTLSKLIDLNLSDNQLDDSCFESLVLLTTRFKLKIFNLAMNKFTKDIFNILTNSYLSLNIIDVEIFDLSDNEFDNETICKILSWLNPINVKSLDISRNFVGYGLLSEIMKLWPNNTNNLKAFKASRCLINDSDLFDLLMKMDNLVDVDLSYNDELTSISLNRLFQKPTIREINLIGCSNLFMHFTDFSMFYDEFCVKSLKISINNSKFDNGEHCKYLIDVWKKWYKDKTIIEFESHLLFLSVDV